MNAPLYQPHGNTKPGRVLAFFAANPEETLTADDIAEKVSMSRHNVHTTMRPAVDAGLLKRERDLLGDYVYSAGPKLAAATPPSPEQPAQVNPAHQAQADAEVAEAEARQRQERRTQTPEVPATALTWPPAPAASRRGKVHLAVAVPEIAALQVETNVPFPGAGTAPGAKWAPLFEKLTDNGHSVAYPLAWHTAVSAQVGKRNRALHASNAGHAFRARKISDTQARLWRIAK